MDEPEIRIRVTQLRSDGTGLTYSDGKLKAGFEWGTEGGILYTRRMAVDAWSGSSHEYHLSADGRRADFSKVAMFDLVSAEMHR